MAEEVEVGESTYLIEFSNGKKKKITVPSDWKVTFGPVAIRKNSDTARDYQNKMPLALRFYESETKQRAIFTNVVNFRDMSIHIEEERVTTQDKHGFMEIDGSKKAMTIQTQVKEWVNPDDEDKANEPAKIVHDISSDKLGDPMED